MENSSRVGRNCWCLLCFVALVAALGWPSPAVAAGRIYAEAPMQVQTKGLTVQEQVRQQVELGFRLSRELPPGTLEKAIPVPLTADDLATVDQGPHWVSPLRIGLVKALIPGIVVAGLDPDALDRQPIGKLRQTADGALSWAVAVRSEEAGAIRLHVEGLSLPANAELFVYSHGGEAYGPYTGSGPNGDGELWTTAVFGSEAILQLRFTGPVDESDLRQVSLRVNEAGIITRNFAGRLWGSDPAARPTPTPKATWPCGNQPCVIDASCVNVAAANPSKLAVAKMEWISGAFIFTCTGGLLSDTNPTQDNFFLTANHCLSGNKDAKNVSFYWQFDTLACNGTCPSNSGWPLVTSGSTVSASNRKGDFTLLHLNTAPPAGAVFLGWNSAPVANTNGAHLFRISNPGFGPQVYSAHDVDTSAPTCSGWPRGERIYSRDITGAIDGGSSGSPVLNGSSQVVGQLSGTCGFNSSAVCESGPGEANATVDGAFAFYFNSVKPFLNP